MTQFHDEASLAATAEELGREAMQRGLIPSFVVRHYPDTRQFYVPDEQQTEPLTPEEAYLKFKRLLERSDA